MRSAPALAWHERPVRLVGATVVALVIGGLVYAGVDRGVFERYDRAAIDSLYPTGPTDDRIVVVGIDQPSIEAHGAWPWGRSLQAELLTAITRAGADVVVHDILLAPPTDSDRALADALEEIDDSVVIMAAVPVGLRRSPTGLLAADQILAPAPEVAAHVEVAHALISPDVHDGVARTMPLVVEGPDRALVPSLTLRAFAASEGIDPTVVLRPEGVQIGDRLFPTDASGRLRISWPDELATSAGSRTVSATDILAGRSIDELRNRTVLVGVTDPTLGDRHDTPIASVAGAPGVLVHAAALNTMHTGAFVTQDAALVTAMWASVLALVVGLLFQFVRASLALIVTVVSGVGQLIVVAIRFADGIEGSVLWPAFGLVLGAVAGLALRYFGETRQTQRVASLFSQYVPEAAARELMHAEKLAAVMAGQYLEVAVLFCDLRGFTPTAGAMEPERVRDLLNIYYERTCRLIVDHDGTVMQYVGDEVFAVFGAPVAADDHASQALDCSIALQGITFDLAEELGSKDLPPIRYGIGVHAGPVIAAHVGDQHRQYAVVGDTVNVGARLCTEAAAGEIVYSEALRARTGKDPIGEACGRIPLKGVDGGAVVWRVPSATSAPPARIEARLP